MKRDDVLSATPCQAFSGVTQRRHLCRAIAGAWRYLLTCRVAQRSSNSVSKYGENQQPVAAVAPTGRR